MAAAAKQKVLLSGGIGAGKTRVAELLTARGAEVISTDRIGHEILEPGGAVHHAVAARWPDTLDGTGLIDRAKLAAVVFLDRAQLEELEELTHPAIHRLALDRTAASTAKVVVVEVPLRRDFLGPGWLRVVVSAARGLRLARVVERGMAAADAEARMAVQPTDEEWREWADYVVQNGGDEAALHEEVDRLWAWLQADPGRAEGRSLLGPRVE